MADIAALSPFHFNRVFRSIIGLPPGEFQSALRLDLARRLLLTTPMSVTDVCFEVGYSSLGSFTTRFTQLVGLPPRGFRRLTELEIDPTGPLPRDGVKGRAGISGSVFAPDGFCGMFFVGLFPSAAPQCRPVAGVIVTSPGPYRIANVPDGRYFLLVAAIRRSSDPLSYLLPSDSLLVGGGEEPIVVRRGAAMAPDVTVRPLHLLDPPILIALPVLLAEYLRDLGMDGRLLGEALRAVGP
jgi:hypothetical protein